MGKWLLEEFSPPEAAWLRYMGALLAYILWVLGVGKSKSNKSLWQSYVLTPSITWDGALLVILGFMAFCFSPWIQMRGLSTSLATENAMIIGMEPLMTSFLAWLILKEKIDRTQLFGFALSLVGFSLLSGIEFKSKSGNFLILISLLGEACYSVLGSRLIRKHRSIEVFGGSLFIGVIFLTCTVAGSLSAFSFSYFMRHLTWKTGIAMFWLGPLGTAAAYAYYLYALSRSSVTYLALLLFLQPLAGAVWGYSFLGDRLNSMQAFGGGLILFSVSIAIVAIQKKSTLKEENKLDVQK